MIDTDKYEGHNLGKMQCGSDSTATIDERKANWNLVQDAPLLLEAYKRLREIINKAMQQHTVLEMREQLFESQCIDAEGQYESGHWERDEE